MPGLLQRRSGTQEQQEASLEAFHKSAFPAAWLSSDKEKERRNKAIKPFLSLSCSTDGSRPSISFTSACGRLVSNTLVVEGLFRRNSKKHTRLSNEFMILVFRFVKPVDNKG